MDPERSALRAALGISSDHGARLRPFQSNPDWVRTPIDGFVLNRLDTEGLSPAPEAPKATLIRRATLDLTGLPPTPDEIDTFLADTSDSAYEALIDRLLRSDRYGEHMASTWLDAARYSDTNGYNNDTPRYNWRYRDWVINAFNRNLRSTNSLPNSSRAICSPTPPSINKSRRVSTETTTSLRRAESLMKNTAWNMSPTASIRQRQCSWP